MGTRVFFFFLKRTLFHLSAREHRCYGPPQTRGPCLGPQREAAEPRISEHAVQLRAFARSRQRCGRPIPAQSGAEIFRPVTSSNGCWPVPLTPYKRTAEPRAMETANQEWPRLLLGESCGRVQKFHHQPRTLQDTQLCFNVIKPTADSLHGRFGFQVFVFTGMRRCWANCQFAIGM